MYETLIASITIFLQNGLKEKQHKVDYLKYLCNNIPPYIVHFSIKLF